MSTTTWHAGPELLQAYVEGRLDAVLGASLERHVDRCAQCRESLSSLVDPSMLDRAWAGVRAGVESPALPRPFRLARRLGLGEPTAILLAATASLRRTWLIGGVIALAFAALATQFAHNAVLWPFLAVAPLIPVIGVAASYGSSEEPFEALAVTTPYGRTRLILARTLAVLAVTVPVAGLLGLTLPGPVWLAASWLGPALAMIPILLALASFTGPRLAAPIVAMLWIGLVLGASRELPQTWPVAASQQLVYLGLALVALVVLAVRSMRTRSIGAVL
ncbi:hypothetical protein BJ980_000014 [Nocardioides daedukensis]|uniref:Putative zinc-finger domain-containing protein n=1 Tax=Nocardioides daedukensis TaxID=634462 RepID=A0A7Y9RX79_9ACTN|nr:zf-HC2 domain-containing protein [Nocardioides daedukensis]NYG57091.1 hypothetical protein [Nocardioides daedukensis]